MPHRIHNQPIQVFEIVRKAFCFENSAFIPHSFGFAYLITDFADAYVSPRIRIIEVLLNIFTEEVIRGLILTLFVFISGLGMYLVVFVFDFITGIKASKKEAYEIYALENKIIPAGSKVKYVESEKLWGSVYKFFAVIVISSILTVFSCVLVIIDQEYLYKGGMLITLFFFFMVISFDIHSIGENQERRFGIKPPFFDKLDHFFKLIGNLLMLRIKRIFNGGSLSEPTYIPPTEEDKEEKKEN